MASISAVCKAYNVDIMDYPLGESIRQALLLCEEVCLYVALSQDDTVEKAFALRDAFPGRVHLFVERAVFDSSWQQRAWEKAYPLSKCDWLLLIDADEALHEQDIETIQGLTTGPYKMVSFPMLHFFGTPSWRKTDFYPRHTRLLHRSVSPWIRDFRAQGGDCCEVMARVGAKETYAHAYSGALLASSNVPLYHYGWVRFSLAKMKHHVFGNAFYNDRSRADGNLDDVRGEYSYNLSALRDTIVPFRGSHPLYLREGWFPKHEAFWSDLERKHGCSISRT